jgi:hypothetical protein
MDRHALRRSAMASGVRGGRDHPGLAPPHARTRPFNLRNAINGASAPTAHRQITVGPQRRFGVPVAWSPRSTSLSVISLAPGSRARARRSAHLAVPSACSPRPGMVIWGYRRLAPVAPVRAWGQAGGAFGYCSAVQCQQGRARRCWAAGFCRACLVPVQRIPVTVHIAPRMVMVANVARAFQAGMGPRQAGTTSPLSGPAALGPGRLAAIAWRRP